MRTHAILLTLSAEPDEKTGTHPRSDTVNNTVVAYLQLAGFGDVEIISHEVHRTGVVRSTAVP